MELYVLDDRNRRVAVIDKFISLIWTERFSAVGDFELQVVTSPGLVSLLQTGTRLGLKGSYRVMLVENTETKKDNEGRKIFKVTGRSLEVVLDWRSVRNGFQSLETLPKMKVANRTPKSVVETLVNWILVDNVSYPEDALPDIRDGVGPGGITNKPYGPGNIPTNTEIVSYEFDNMTLYSAVKQVCDAWDMGFRLLRDPDISLIYGSEIYFQVYNGSDRTSSQTVLPPVIFSEDLDNLTNISEYSSISNYRNVAYVYNAKASVSVLADDAGPIPIGYSRRVLPVAATDINLPAGAELTKALLQRGKDELMKVRPVYALDGEIGQNPQYKYEVDYRLGDLVEMRIENGATNRMRVVEQIFVSDAQGERMYPTLALNLFVTPGSWLGQDMSTTWSVATGEWKDR